MAPDILETARKEIEQNSQDTEDLEIYVVGGAVRDFLLDKEFSDLDFTVVGESPATMKERGFKEIEAQSFPVFQDSEGNEIALARRESSTGDGYHEFNTEITNVSIEEDLERRDFTMNAVAINLDTGVWEYPVAVEGNRDAHSIKDINTGIIRHITDAFEEDPVRILRMARFASRYPDFEIAKDTKFKAKRNAEKLEEVAGERIQEELIKAMEEAEQPTRFFEVLKKVKALNYFMPKVAQFKDVSAGAEKYHEEGDLWSHTMMTIKEAHKIDPNNANLLLMALVHDIGKVETQDEENSGGHDMLGIPLIEEMSYRLKFSNELEEKLVDASRHHMRIHNTPLKADDSMREKTVIDFVQKINRGKGATIDELLKLCEADARGREPEQDIDKEGIKQRLAVAQEAIDEVDASYSARKRGGIIEDFEGEALGQMVTQDRIEYMRDRQEIIGDGFLEQIKKKYF